MLSLLGLILLLAVGILCLYFAVLSKLARKDLTMAFLKVTPMTAPALISECLRYSDASLGRICYWCL